MTRLTLAEIARAIKAADQAGKVAVMVKGGIAFVEPDKVPLPVQPPHDPFDLVDMSK